MTLFFKITSVISWIASLLLSIVVILVVVAFLRDLAVAGLRRKPVSKSA